MCGENTDRLNNVTAPEGWQHDVALAKATAVSDTDGQVQAWRLSRLLRLGFTGVILDMLAESPADLHVAEQLVGAGCPLDTAALILL